MGAVVGAVVGMMVGAVVGAVVGMVVGTVRFVEGDILGLKTDAVVDVNGELLDLGIWPQATIPRTIQQTTIRAANCFIKIPPFIFVL